MRKIINTLKYGEKKVKRSLILAILAGLVTVAFVVLAILLSNMLCFFVAIVAGFITISLVQTFMIAEGANPTVAKASNDIGDGSLEHMKINHKSPSVKGKEKNNKKTKKKKAKKEKVKKEKIKKQKVKKEKPAKISKSSQAIHEEDDVVAPWQVEYQGELDMAALLEQTQPGINPSIQKPDKDYDYDEHSDYVDNDYRDKEEQEEEDTSNRKFKVITADTAASYTKKKIKKTLHKYKVMKDHRMVIVDRSDKYHIYQTPAYVWVQDNQFHILLIEEEPRLLMIPLFRITEITHLKKQPADEEKDYKLFKKSTILTESFRPYLPDYNHSNKTTDLASYKNLYGITQGIYFTNNSAKNLFDLLGVEFFVEDKVTTSNKVNIFFKEAYKANIKLRDNILDANGYADSITKILDDMAHSSISYAEFKDTLNLMTRNKLITDEYANYYMGVRNSIVG